MKKSLLLLLLLCSCKENPVSNDFDTTKERIGKQYTHMTDWSWKGDTLNVKILNANMMQQNHTKYVWIDVHSGGDTILSKLESSSLKSFSFVFEKQYHIDIVMAYFYE